MPERRYWLVKSEPSVYPYAQLVADGRTEWTGVRNFEARNNLRAMRKGDLALYYHSNEGKEIVGVVKVVAQAGPDSTAPGEDWASVQLAPLVALEAPVPLATIKSTAALRDFPLLTRSRLSVTPVSAAHFRAILKLGRTPERF